MAEHKQVDSWDSVFTLYQRWADNAQWPYFSHTLRLIACLREDPTIGQLWPCTSLFSLLLNRRPGYHPEDPFISVQTMEDGTFKLQLFQRVTKPKGRKFRRSFDDAVEAIRQMANQM